MRSLATVALLVLGACQAGEPTLGSTEQLAVVTSPASSFAFGSTQVGQISAPTTIEVRPASLSTASYDDVTAVTASCPDFSVSAPGLPAPVYRTVICDTCTTPPCPVPVLPVCTTDQYVTYRFTATFRPTVAGSVSCVVTIVTNNTTSRTVTLSGTGTVPPIDIDVQPTQVAFGDVRRSTTSTQATVHVRNLGSSTLNVSSVSISSGFAIVAGPAGAVSVPPGGSQPYSLVCTPTAVGPLSGAFQIASDDPATPNVSVSLGCNGIDSNLDVTPSPSIIPTTRVGEPRTIAITLTNTGVAPMTLMSVVLTGAGLTMSGAPPPDTVLAAGSGTATVQVQFAATASGDATGTIVVTYDGGQTRSVPVAARALLTSMALSPDGAVDLGPVCIGQSTNQSFTVIANDQAAFVINQISAPDAPFTLRPPILPATVQGAGATKVAFDVTAAPTVEGASSSTVAVTTDIPGAQPRVIQLAVTGLAAGISGTPAELDFGSNLVDVTTLGQSVAITNCSTSPATLSNARIGGPDASEFAIVLPPQSSTVAPNSSASWLVVMQPRAVGVKHATFSVDHEGGTVTVDLTGEGLDDAPGTGGTTSGGPASYYACSASGGSGALMPIALALGLVLRRRRTHSAFDRS